MKLLAVLVTVTVLAAIVAANRDDIMRHVKMRQYGEVPGATRP